MNVKTNPILKDVEQPPEIKHLADFCLAIGSRFFVIGGLFWMSRGMRLFSPWPSSRPISLSQNDLRYIWKQGALFIHYASSDDKPFFLGYDLVVDDKKYDLESIRSSKRRRNISSALRSCSVEPVSFESLVKSSQPLIEDTHSRQGRAFNPAVLEMWKNYFRSAGSNPLFEAYGAFVSNQLAAFHVCVSVSGGVYIEMTFSRTEFLKYHPVDALCFAFTKKAMARDYVNHVSYGTRPITGEAKGLVNFKESMGFRKIPLKERVEVTNILKPVLCGPLTPVVRTIANRYSDRSMYARIVTGVMDTLHGYVAHSNREQFNGSMFE